MHVATETTRPANAGRVISNVSRQRRTLPPGDPGSTIRAVELNGRVRDGNGCSLYAIATDKQQTAATSRILLYA